MTRDPAPELISVERLATLSDGVFAIAMTVLALELTSGVSADVPLTAMVSETLPRVAAYVMSFLILGLLWIANHSTLTQVRRTTRRHIALVLVFLMLVAAIPFPAALVGTHPNDPWAFAVYGAMLTLTVVCLEFSWWYARAKSDDSESSLTLTDRSALLGTALSRRIALAIGSYTLAVALAFVHPWLGFVGFLASHTVLTIVPLKMRR